MFLLKSPPVSIIALHQVEIDKTELQLDGFFVNVINSRKKIKQVLVWMARIITVHQSSETSISVAIDAKGIGKVDSFETFD